MADPKPQTFYAADDVVLDFPSTDGMSEQVTFKAGKTTTSNPAHIAILERYAALGIVSAKPKADPKD